MTSTISARPHHSCRSRPVRLTDISARKESARTRSTIRRGRLPHTRPGAFAPLSLRRERGAIPSLPSKCDRASLPAGTDRRLAIRSRPPGLASATACKQMYRSASLGDIKNASKIFVTAPMPDHRAGGLHHRGRGHRHEGELELFEEGRRLGGHGRRGRPLGQGELRYLLLHLLDERPRHGYDLIRAVEELTGGTYAPSPGVVYPTLTLLEELGYTELAESDGAKKQYVLTASGREALKANEPEVRQMLSRLAHLAETTTGAVDPEVLRASQNVSRALFLRPGRKPWTVEQARRVADILDRAAAEIEQI